MSALSEKSGLAKIEVYASKQLGVWYSDDVIKDGKVIHSTSRFVGYNPGDTVPADAADGLAKKIADAIW